MRSSGQEVSSRPEQHMYYGQEGKTSRETCPTIEKKFHPYPGNSPVSCRMRNVSRQKASNVAQVLQLCDDHRVST